ncbi:S-adenosyl-L-methionine-dependent methyltransferase [Tilletiaria anomala UBC 951]|uniref:S-adenosyl-L-methionine-dependent methyltransferase n=1 Tax=Tilletiaria anomala (strain ATCC 24038 / CBS 436.72 / UBC 951) TaxID=1037660 RepID=A0A066WI53_TILAU|nr:S-adenosyl-L-methionine-dependent methyltransferase [Tilletiaria anomala UBC 951]KDN52213.1 S-adenosyl-L-methionine-dependent methyltransferase [Tilletiaria anomala UBC 951]
MSGPNSLTIWLTIGMGLGLVAALIGPTPTRLPDRLAVIPDSAVHIDNHIYDKEDFGWDDAEHPLKLVNGARIPYFVDTLREKLGKGPLKLLDVGCGGGIATIEMAAAGFNVTGLDASAISVKAAEKMAKERSLSIQYVHGSAYSLPYHDDSFDAVLSSDVLEHLHDVRQALKEVTRVLRPGGVFVFDTINRSVFSWVVIIRLMQDWLRYIPEAVHDWKLFITPTELRRALQDAGLEPCPSGAQHGMRPTFRLNPLSISRRLIKQGPGAFIDVWKQDMFFMGGSYLGYATKP